MHALKDVQELRTALRKGHVQFIRTELDLALTFLDVADTTRDPSTRQRNVENA